MKRRPNAAAPAPVDFYKALFDFAPAIDVFLKSHLSQ